MDFALAATDGQHAALDLQVQVFFLEAGGGDDDAILVVTVLFDVVGRVGTPGLIAQGRLEQIVEAIEAYGMTEQRGEEKALLIANLLNYQQVLWCGTRLRHPARTR